MHHHRHTQKQQRQHSQNKDIHHDKKDYLRVSITNIRTLYLTVTNPISQSAAPKIETVDNLTIASSGSQAIVLDYPSTSLNKSEIPGAAAFTSVPNTNSAPVMTERKRQGQQPSTTKHPPKTPQTPAPAAGIERPNEIQIGTAREAGLS